MMIKIIMKISGFLGGDISFAKQENG